MEIGEPTSKTLKKLRQELHKRDIMEHAQYYRTATLYLTRHLPLAIELTHELAVFHPLMLKEEHACQVIPQFLAAIYKIYTDFPICLLELTASTLWFPWTLYLLRLCFTRYPQLLTTQLIVSVKHVHTVTLFIFFHYRLFLYRLDNAHHSFFASHVYTQLRIH